MALYFLYCLNVLYYNVNFALLIIQAKYQSVCEASSVRIVTPDWIVRCVEAMSRIDEIQYHPRLLLSGSQESVHKASSATSPTHCLSQHNCQLDISELSSAVVSDTSLCVSPYVITASEKSISAVSVSAIPTTVVSQQHVRTYLKSIGNGNDHWTTVCQNPLKSFGSTKVCIKVSCSLLKVALLWLSFSLCLLFCFKNVLFGLLS